MTQHLLTIGLFCAAQLFAGCQKDSDVRPGNYDELAMATGHWEWESSVSQSGRMTPATVGFSRNLVFGAGGSLVVQRSGQADYRTTYQLSMGIPKPCGGPSAVPLVTYTSEQDIGNTPIKIYELTQRNNQQTLTLTGESLCVDGGSYETYHWVSE